MEEIYEKIIDNVKELMEIKDEPKLKLRTTILVRKCLNFMNRKDFPVELIEPFAEHLALKNIEENSVNTQNMKSITEGDTKIEYDSATNVTDEIFLSLKAQLYRFRKVGTLWVY